jgi:hypothetical protein
MKRLFLIVAIIVCGLSPIIAQTINYPCDISSLGMELRNTAGTAIVANIPASGTGSIRIPIVNIGTGQTGGGSCSYPIGTVYAILAFYAPSSENYFCRYNGPASFTSGKYDFAWNSAENILVGVNNTPIINSFAGAESVLVPIAGVRAGAAYLNLLLQTVSTSGDDVSNNSKTLLVTAVGPSGGVLPITLESIDGSGDKCNAQIKWSTSNETNLSKFEIEVSKDGVDFDKAGTIKPSSLNAGNYQFNTTQSSGKNYYRLKIIDQNGSFTYSKVIPITTNCSDKVVKVFPNPVNTAQTLNVNISGYDKSIKGDLYSATGQFIKSFILKNGKNDLTVENLSQGFYTLKISENGTQTEVFKLNVVR